MELTGRFPCYNTFETRDGRWVTVGAYEPHFWAALCRHFGRDDFVDKQFDEAARAEMLAVFRDGFRRKTLAEWMAELGDQDICFGPVNEIDEVYADPQVRHRGMFTPSPDGPPTLGNPVKLSDTPPSIRTPPPALGQHTDDVLRALGFDAQQIADLRERHVV
jgi:crotonobetainyl-CoA:carnitine CoA-transferase CaiB-like acyl-CoA transferase